MYDSLRMQSVQSPIIPVVGELIRSNPGTISLGQGVAYYDPPPQAIEAIEKFLADPENHKYKLVQGIGDLEPPQFEGQVDGWSTNAMKMLCLNRHNGFSNTVFADFSTRTVGLKELWTLKWNREFDINGSWTRAGGAQPEDWPQWMRNFKDY